MFKHLSLSGDILIQTTMLARAECICLSVSGCKSNQEKQRRNQGSGITANELESSSFIKNPDAAPTCKEVWLAGHWLYTGCTGGWSPMNHAFRE